MNENSKSRYTQINTTFTGMKKYLLSFLFTVLLCAVGNTARAQDTCKSYNVPNPHGAAMSIYKIWVVDSTNFTVESLKPIPYDITATGTVDFRVCLLPRDGVKRTTQVRYQNTHGTSSYTVTITPPTSSVKRTPDQAQLNAYPNPAANRVEIALGSFELNNLSVDLIDVRGNIINPPFDVASSKIVLNTSAMVSGAYTVVIKNSTHILGVSQLAVVH